MTLHTIFPDESKAAAPQEPQNFIGAVRHQNFVTGSGAQAIELLAVFFPAGGRTRPHAHRTDQMLHFLGDGFVSTPEGEQRVSAGEIVVIPAGVVHMHGATDDAAVCHIACRPPGPTDWSPPVPEEWRRYTLGG